MMTEKTKGRGRPKGSPNKSKDQKKKPIKNKALDFHCVDPIAISVTSAEPETESRPQRDARGYFLPGNTMTKGTRNPYKKILEKISGEEFTEVKNAVMDKAKKGDLQAAQIILKYLIPSGPEPEGIRGLKTKSVIELNESMDVVIEHMAEGLISPEGALNYVKCLDQKRSFIQSAFLENRIVEVENRIRSVEKK